MLTPVLRVEDLAVVRGRRRVVSGLALQVAAGEIVALVGDNGCGKSTLMGAVAGLYLPRQGVVQIDGHDVWGPPRQRQAARRALGYLPEGGEGGEGSGGAGGEGSHALGFLSGAELWALVGAARGAPPPAPELMAELGLAELADKKLGQMSLGQRRRAYLGAALLGPPRLLVLDEPDNGLDVTRLEALVALLRSHREHGGVLVASHDPALVERLGARVVTMRAA
ncbi:MAG TPA: ABC transporter ATP-binding protein [Kofleriaceae bacterium]|nr:ABC transporter ATP-binding protein [Kofleriaceae bacterium]